MRMATKIVGFDSEFDETSQLVANWRRKHVYARLKADGHQLKILEGNMANRIYLSKELLKEGVRFFSASGHGLYHEFQGSDGTASLSIGDYAAAEANGKIIHLLSCLTAFELGADLVQNGCTAFFGYDISFQFTKTRLDDFMAPDAELDFALSGGDTAKVAHEKMIKVYQQKIQQLITAGEYESASMMTANMNHVCSAVKDEQWGKSSSTL